MNRDLITPHRAGGAITGCRIVSHGSADLDVTQAATTTEDLIGVADGWLIDGVANTYATADTVDVHRSGIAEVLYGGTVTRGQPLTSDANGKAVAATPAALVQTVIAGGAAGALTLTGIATTDTLVSVLDESRDVPVVEVIAGGSAGDLTVTGIATGDTLVSVVYVVGAGTAVTNVSDLTSEFSISAANTINNTGGTATTGGKLIVTYLDASLETTADLTSEFSISAANTITNVGGTATTGDRLLVTYRKAPTRIVGYAERSGVTGDLGEVFLAPGLI